MMDLAASSELDELRFRLRRLIDEHAPDIYVRPGTRAAESQDELDARKEWSKALYQSGFAGRNWPPEWGGMEAATPLEDFMIAEEIARARVPSHLSFAAYAAHACLNFGTEAQKAEFLPKTRDSDIVWCQLFSEPGGGSDLAALKTRADRRGARYVINGQKVWNTQAQWADYGFLLARTSTEGSKHAGITAFFIYMRQPGVTVQPIREITGTEDFNEVFFTDAEVPIFSRIGGEGEGWTVATSSLAKERTATAAYGISTRNSLNDLIAIARALQANGVVLPDGARDRLVKLHAQVTISNLHGHIIATREANGVPRLADPPISKLFFGDTNLAVATCALDLLGELSLYQENEPRSVGKGWWPDMFLYARAYTIAGGSSEVIRNILSERVLGMPK